LRVLSNSIDKSSARRLSFGAGNQTAIIAGQLMDAKTLGLTGNNNTPYIFLMLDTKDGPLVVEIPPGVLGMLDESTGAERE
jgi:hypothetical protein